ncbi:MAG TPA: isochorismate synthase, partial [Gemmatimonadaceae bacterium]|nr:isochorismate synthase [Gemmatimonadaceae bacterium]
APASGWPELLARARTRARALGRPVLATWVEPAPEDVEPMDVLARATGAEDRIYWSHPEAGLAYAAVGAAVHVAPSGAGRRFASAARLWGALRADMVRGAAEGVPDQVVAAMPMLAGGFSFDPLRPATPLWLGFPDAWLAVPELALRVDRDGRWLVSSAFVRPGDEPVLVADRTLRERASILGRGGEDERADAWALIASAFRPRAEGRAPATIEPLVDPARWRERVARAAAAVQGGEMEKVVLARAVRRRAAAAPELPSLLRRLEAEYRACRVFAIVRGRRTFVGATPERLVALERGVVRATALAGSVRRGATPDEDARLAASLMASAKDRLEHDIVVRALREGLAELADDVRAPDGPETVTMANVHHLHTPLTARPRTGVGLLDLVARLHPTPAVGGVPREAALAWLRAHEELDRGWYAAPIGWIGADGDGEFAVALRSALLDGATATLFAGCGVMGDSDPESELAESELKLRPMMQALDGEDATARGGDAREGDA